MFILKKRYSNSKKNAIISLVVFCFLFIGNNTQAVFLDNFLGGKAGGLQKTATTAGFEETDKTPMTVFAEAISGFLGFLGIIFLILMIRGGYIWMKAQGNDSEATKAKGIILDSLIGLIITLSAWAISAVVFNLLINYSDI